MTQLENDWKILQSILVDERKRREILPSAERAMRIHEIDLAIAAATRIKDAAKVQAAKQGTLFETPPANRRGGY